MPVLVKPLISTTIDTALLARAVKESRFDNLSSNLETEAKGLALLVKAVDHRSSLSDVEALRTTGNLCQHLHYGFLVVCQERLALDLVTHAQVCYTIAPTARDDYVLCVISGTLCEWIATLTYCLVPRMSTGVREILTKCMDHFDTLGYQHLFSQYRRKKAKDNTLLLEDKR